MKSKEPVPKTSFEILVAIAEMQDHLNHNPSFEFRNHNLEDEITVLCCHVNTNNCVYSTAILINEH